MRLPVVGPIAIAGVLAFAGYHLASVNNSSGSAASTHQGVVQAAGPVTYTTCRTLAPTGAVTFTYPAGTVTTPATTYAYTAGVGTDTAPLGDTYDVCGQAAGYVLAGILEDLQASSLYTNWAKANPGELGRVKAYLADTTPWDGGPSVARYRMITAFGSMLRDVISTCKVLLCPPQAWPPPPSITKYPDTTPPSAP